MSHTVDTRLIERIRRFGAFDVSACFNCGNCTAVCPLSAEGSSFPRRLIRYGQVGMEKRLLADKDLWLCYYCGECSQTCPRQAAPGAYMAAARRYAISRYDVTGLARLLLGSGVMQLVVFLLLSALFTGLLLWKQGDINGHELALFRFIPGEVIHNLGIGVMVVVGLAAVVGVLSMLWRAVQFQRAAGHPLALAWKPIISSALYAIGESLGQRRYRECDEDKIAYPWYRKPWLVHAAMLWGFLGLLAATVLDFVLKPIGMPVSLLYPARLLGTVAGFVSLYGLGFVTYYRLHKPAVPYADTRFADGFFLALLFAAVLTGTVTEIVVYWGAPSLWSYVVFLVHVVLAMDLLVMLPLTKFAHAMYRPLALFLHRWAALSQAAAGEL